MSLQKAYTPVTHGKKKVHIYARERLGRLFDFENSKCPFCSQLETVQHMLLACPFTKAIWFTNYWSFNLDHYKNINIKEWIELVLKPPSDWRYPKEFWTTSCLYIAWNIWKHRSEVIFEKIKPMNPIKLADIIFNQIQKITPQAFEKKTPSNPKLWNYPLPTHFKLNVDISFVDSSTAIGIGYVLRSDNGSFKGAGVDLDFCRTAEEAECIGLLRAVTWVMNLQIWTDIVQIMLEMDCKAASNFLMNQPTNLSWQGQQTLLDLQRMSHQFISLVFSFAPRSCNMVAHNLANRARAIPPFSWLNEPPLWLKCDLNTDIQFCNMLSVD